MGYNNDFVTVPKASENAYGDQTGDSNNSSQNISSKSDNSSRKSKGDRDIKARRAKKNSDEDDKNQNKLMQEAGKKAGKKSVTNLLKGALKQGFLATLRNMVNYIWNLAKAAVGFIAKLPFVLAVGVVGLAITAIVAITTAVATTTTQEVVSTLDSVPEKPTAYVRSAATGNSDYEIEFATKTLPFAQREMARRIWTTFGGFKVKEITNFLPGVNPLDPDAPISPDTPLVGDTAMAQIWNFFKGKGLSANAIAGLMGNLQAESGFNPKAFNPGGGGKGAYGIAQWRAGRQDALRKYAAEHGGQASSLEMQLGYLWYELNHGYTGVLTALRNASDIKTASTAVLQDFEKPGDSRKQSTINYRAGLGNKIYAQLNGQLPGGIEPDVPTSPVTPIEGKTVTAKISYGLRPEQICGLLGNWATDSQLDPTAVDTVNNEPFRIGPVKQRAQVSDFVSKFGWSENQRALSTYKAGIGLGKWQDLGDINTTNLDLHNPGRNTKLMTYAKLYGRKYYLNVDGSSNGWNSEKWVDGDTNTEGLWYDPKVQLAFALDTSEVGDKVGEDKYAEWLWDWSKIGSDLFAGDKMPNIVGNDATYGLRVDTDEHISGWHADWRGGSKNYYVVPGYNAPDPPPNGAKWESEECGWGRVPGGQGYFVVDNEMKINGTVDGNGKVNAIGDETADRFHYEDLDVRIKTFKGASVEPYYSTRSQYGRNDWKYEKWDVKDAVSTKNINWEKESIHDKMIDLNNYGTEHAARKLAFEYAYKSADACWYGRLNDVDDPGVMFPNEAGVNEASKYAYKNPDTPAIKNPSEFATKSYNSNFLIDNDIRKSESGPYSLESGHGYQHWGRIEDECYTLPDGSEHVQYGWIKDANPAEAANNAAFMQYQQCFKIVYRYHLYRIMTDYYTAQFLKQYENIDDAETLKKRQKIARQYFQMWWDSGQCEDIEGKSEPNKYAELDKRPVVAQDPELDENYLGLNESEFDDNFFKIEQGYAQGIMQGIERTQDKLEEHETDHKVYKSDYKMANGEHIANTTNVAIAKAAALIAWPTLAQSYGNDGIDCYKEIHDKVFSLFGGGDDIYQSCDRTVATAIRWSGCDDNFPGGNTLVQMEYLNSSPRWTEIDWGGDINCLRPGDVLIRKDSLMMGADGEKPEDAHHVLIYVGNYWCKACYKTWGKAPFGSKCPKNITIVEGSYGEHSPAMTSLGENEVRSFHAYRCTDPMASNKSKYNGITFTVGNVTTWPDDPDTPEDPVDPPDPDNYEDNPVDGREDGIIGIEDTDDSINDEDTIDEIINKPDSPNPDPVPQDIEEFLQLLENESLNMTPEMKATLQWMLETFTGVPYSKEGAATESATDCSGLIWQVFGKKLGMLPGRYSADTYGKSYTYGVSDPKPGDLIFFKGTSSQRSASQYSHVGVYLGHGRFFHASSSGCHVTDIRKSSYWQRHQPEIRRIRP